MVSTGRSPVAQVGRWLQRAMRAVAAQSNQAVECGGSDPTGEESGAAVAAEEMTRMLRPRSRRWGGGNVRSRDRGGQFLRLDLAAALSDGGGAAGSWGIRLGRGGGGANVAALFPSGGLQRLRPAVGKRDDWIKTARRRRANMVAVFSRRRSPTTAARRRGAAATGSRAATNGIFLIEPSQRW
jgi:hypothetical protein